MSFPDALQGQVYCTQHLYKSPNGKVLILVLRGIFESLVSGPIHCQGWQAVPLSPDHLGHSGIRSQHQLVIWRYFQSER